MQTPSLRNERVAMLRYIRWELTELKRREKQLMQQLRKSRSSDFVERCGDFLVRVVITPTSVRLLEIEE